MADSPSISPRRIADQLRLARPTVSNLIQAMRRQGLLTLARNADDARAVHVRVTDLAADLLRRYDGTSEKILSAALAELTVEEQAAIAAATPALVALQGILTATDVRS